MSKVRARGEGIRRFILENVEKQSDNLSRLASDKFGISRQAVNKHLQRLTAEGALTESGNTRARVYKIAPIAPTWTANYTIKEKPEESAVWVAEIKPHLGQLPDNVLNIWQIGFTEMFNNALEHSQGDVITVQIAKTALNCELCIIDDGVGIFEKIQYALNLADPRHAVLELAKGKFTTDPRHHSGQGIFFTSRMFDTFNIVSKGVAYSHEINTPDEDWIMDNATTAKVGGTGVFLKLDNHTARTAAKIYNQFSTIDEPGFSKTVVPVSLARYGDDELISRSQAKRLLARFDLFKTVLLDFSNVSSIGQAFADEIFRVFVSQHPEVELVHIHTGAEVAKMIARARGEEP